MTRIHFVNGAPMQLVKALNNCHTHTHTSNNDLSLSLALTPIKDAGALELAQQARDEMRLNLVNSNADQIADQIADGMNYAAPKQQVNILLSYHYYKKVNIDAFMQKFITPPRLFIDSGGFSAFTQGIDIPLPEYCAFLKRWQHHITTQAVLDDIKDPEKTWENQQRMEDAGCPVIPCFHTGEDFTWLEHYAERYPYIAIGGMVPYLRTPQRLISWLVKAFKLVQHRSVFHGFGATSWKLASVLPWYSVDSSSWAACVRYGQVDVFDSRAGEFKHLVLGVAADWDKHTRLVQSLGFDAAFFKHIKRGTPATGNYREQILGLSARSYLEAEAWLTKRHGVLTIPERGMK